MIDESDGRSDELPPEMMVRVDKVCDRFEAAWNSGSPPRIQDYLQGVPEEARAVLARELMLLDLDYRKRRGEKASAADYVDLAPSLGANRHAPPPMPRLARVTFTVMAGPNKGQTYSFAGHDTFLVGRSKHAHFHIDDRYCSRIHFMVEVNPPVCRLMDMGSRSGTRVNGRRVAKADLKAGDQVRAGRSLVRVSVEGDEPVPATTTELNPAPPRPLPRRPPMPVRPTRVDQVCCVCATALAAESPKRTGRTMACLCDTCGNLMRDHSQPIAGYRMVQELGRGNMGVVYVALNEAGIPVALKTVVPAVTPSATQLARFQREAQILYELDHPNIVAFHDLGGCNGTLYFAMDYVRGTDAGKLLKHQGPQPVRRAVGLICQLLQALEYAHAKGFVHRDIKPSNILLRAEGKRETALLADFGLARVYQASQLSGLTMTGDIGGTIPYMPPEQITDFRNARPPADQYAAGATLYQLLSGALPHDLPDKAEERLLTILYKAPVPIRTRRPDLPAALARVIHRSLEKDPRDRFADAKAFRKALLPFAS
jgi:serine/threonine-protein kinase